MRRRARLRAMLVVTLLIASTGCTGPDRQTGGTDFDPAPVGPSWAPRPSQSVGLSTLAEVRGDRYLLHTRHGDVGFLPGVNLGPTTPGHQPGELAISAQDVRRWLPLMRELGFRVVRVYTIMPPHFYTELADYNADHPDAPLYLMQGVYLPDESYLDSGDLYERGMTTSFTEELRDASSAVHGELERAPQRGRAAGQWTADVSPWLAGWIIGAELDPYALRSTNERNAGLAPYEGRYFRSAEAANPSERWLAARMDELAGEEAERGTSVPIAFVNWPTLDPLTHPEEPREGEDLVGLDANLIEATDAWPGGTFASYHAYPHYPDFQRYEPGLRMRRRGKIDPYAGYLAALRRHHAGTPVLLSEFGTPSSLGTAHFAPLGRGQGNHSEQQAMAIDAELLRTIHELGMAGGLLFSWTDEWFKLTWNTQPRQLPADRRQLWHDPLTNEQYFGIVATDPGAEPASAETVIAEDRAGTVRAGTDESYVHLEIQGANRLQGRVTLGFDVVRGGTRVLPGTDIAADGADYAVVVDIGDGTADTARAWVREQQDPVLLDNLRGALPRPVPVDGWRLQQLTVNGPRTVPSTGEELPAEFFDVGDLRPGEFRPREPGYDSRATWQVDRNVLKLRMPWGLLGMADPSSKRALVIRPDRTATTTTVERIGLTVHLGDRRIDTEGIGWEPWNAVEYRERVKAGVQPLVDAIAEVTPR